jgi:hypothetical protein
VHGGGASSDRVALQRNKSDDSNAYQRAYNGWIKSIKDGSSNEPIQIGNGTIAQRFMGRLPSREGWLIETGRNIEMALAYVPGLHEFSAMLIADDEDRPTVEFIISGARGVELTRHHADLGVIQVTSRRVRSASELSKQLVVFFKLVAPLAPVEITLLKDRDTTGTLGACCQGELEGIGCGVPSWEECDEGLRPWSLSTSIGACGLQSRAAVTDWRGHPCFTPQCGFSTKLPEQWCG